MSVILYIRGTYHFARKLVGFRPDFCLACRRDTVALETRSFDAWHLFWIPLIPLGFQRHWQCSACRSNPRPVRTSGGFKRLGIPVFLLAGLAEWAVPAEGPEAGMIWMFRIAFPALALWLYFSLGQDKQDDNMLRDRLRRVPHLGDNCPICRGRLIPTSPRRCTACGAVEQRPPELARA
jgi:hypothetical protein